MEKKNFGPQNGFKEECGFKQFDRYHDPIIMS